MSYFGASKLARVKAGKQDYPALMEAVGKIAITVTYRRIEYNLQVAAAQRRKLKLVLYTPELQTIFFRQTP